MELIEPVPNGIKLRGIIDDFQDDTLALKGRPEYSPG